MTPPGAEHTLAPERSDGFASVGAASHRKRVALLPGGPFAVKNDACDGELATRLGSLGVGTEVVALSLQKT